MYKITLTPAASWTDAAWKEFGAIMEYVFKFYKGDTYSVMELAVAMDRNYRNKDSLFYPMYMDGAILVHLRSEVENNGIEDMGVPMFTITSQNSKNG